ncbi:hypothetical protein [Demequina iriomotensis]|uniref:hypothetical protein n=1 Tax=Demequina iriomotensis TaxID=1536641 RepID=UPI000785FDB8|nr:hypothetical protein [Demequina iriomotensis]
MRSTVPTTAVDIPVPALEAVVPDAPGAFGGPGFVEGFAGLGLVAVGLVVLVGAVAFSLAGAIARRPRGRGLGIAYVVALVLVGGGGVMLLVSGHVSDAAQAEYEAAIAVQEDELDRVAAGLAADVLAQTGVTVSNPASVVVNLDGPQLVDGVDAAGADVACAVTGTRDGAGWTVRVECPAPAS